MGNPGNDNEPIEVRIVSKRNWVERLGAWAPIIISLLALCFAVYQGIQSRKHERLSVLPNLQSNTELTTNPPRAAISFENNGLGPAVVTACQVFVDGRRFRYGCGEGREAWLAVLDELRINEPWIRYRYIADGYPIAKGDRVTLLEVVESESTKAHIADFEKLVMPRLTLAVCYCSVYDDQCGSTSAGGARDIRIDCPTN